MPAATALAAATTALTLAAGSGVLLTAPASAAATARPAAAAAAPSAGGTYQLAVTASGKCIDVPEASSDNGALLQQWGCTDGASWQQFKVTSVGSGVYELANVSSGKCIDVPSGVATEGLQVQQWGCGTDKTNQQWTLTADGSGYRLKNVKSGLCLADKDASTASGNPIVQQACASTAAQQWSFNPVGGSVEGDITVAKDGSGDYTTVQAAVNAVGTGGSSEVVIAIKAGTYREQVSIPSNKPYITFEGAGSSPSDVVIVNNKNAGDYGTQGCATISIQGDNFRAHNLTFSNDFDENTPNNGAQALAMYLDADRVVLDNVRLLADQDTLQVHDDARTYIRNSYIEGTVDFIYGGGIAVFDSDRIYEKRSTGGPITAASTPADQKYGFLFYKSTITGATNNTTQLGRPWRADAQVLYRESSLSATIATAQPWINMSDNTWQNARFKEYKNTGSGATTNGNRPQLSDSDAPNYTPQKYLAGSDGWNPIG
ncbi:pectinesterase family protein [Streptomyces odontomachi]|uniref:pectinesterase family protein n=1 Tax=Streptomyces odontomachi TaxID=2944940 RepID=UPI002108E898|nr:pectinesterase family protein [Streptomyces sp. ODS25]